MLFVECVREAKTSILRPRSTGMIFVFDPGSIPRYGVLGSVRRVWISQVEEVWVGHHPVCRVGVEKCERQATAGPTQDSRT